MNRPQAIVLASICAVIPTACGGHHSSGTDAHPGPSRPATPGQAGGVPQVGGDVAVTRCRHAAGGVTAATVKVTNHTTTPNRYIVNVVIAAKSGGGRPQMRHITIGVVLPERTVTRVIRSKRPVTGHATCSVGAIQRSRAST